MAIEFVLFTSEWEAAVARFNDRMRAGNAPTAFGLPSRAGTPRAGMVHARHYLAVEGTEVRGGILILEHPATINDTTPLGGGASIVFSPSVLIANSIIFFVASVIIPCP